MTGSFGDALLMRPAVPAHGSDVDKEAPRDVVPLEEGAASPDTKDKRWDIPNEIYDHIASFLDVEDVHNMRLASRKFADSLLNSLVRPVYLSFRPSLATKNTSDCNYLQRLGHNVQRFAIVSEMDEIEFAYFPFEPEQRLVITWWGVYRWPKDEPDNDVYVTNFLDTIMKDSTVITSVIEQIPRTHSLAISLDSGLGFISFCHTPESRLSTKLADGKTIRRRWLLSESNRNTYFDPSDSQFILRRMVSAAGFKDKSMDSVMALLDSCEGRHVTDAHLGLGLAHSINISVSQTASAAAFADQAESLGTGARLGVPATAGGPGPTPVVVDSIPIPARGERAVGISQGQMKMLRDSELAHKWVLKSIVAGLTMPTPSLVDNLHTIHIPKLSSYLIITLSKPQMWASLTNLTTLSLGIVPDWRKITSSPLELQEVEVAPVESVNAVFLFIKACIAPHKKLRRFHFEWVNGGEFGPHFTRNRYILPLPLVEWETNFLPQHELAELDSGPQDTLLQLPNLKTLSLKNAWAPPHILLPAIEQMAGQSLRALELESISLSGETVVPTDNTPQRRHIAELVGRLASTLPATGPFVLRNETDTAFPNLHGGNPAWQGQVNPNSTPSGLIGKVLGAPNAGSWVHFIDYFTPETTVALWLENRHSSNTATTATDAAVQDDDHDDSSSSMDLEMEGNEIFSPNMLIHHRSRSPNTAHPRLLDMTFKSCGYVHIQDHRICSLSILPRLAYSNLHALLLITRHSNGFTHRNVHVDIQTPLGTAYLGEIVRFILPDEAVTLKRVFGMEQGWEGVYDQEVIDDAARDGVGATDRVLNEARGCGSPGDGRFSGEIHAKGRTRTRVEAGMGH